MTNLGLQGVEASPYNDPHVIAGAGVGGLEIVEALKRDGRTLSHFVCQVSGGGLMCVDFDITLLRFSRFAGASAAVTMPHRAIYAAVLNVLR